MIRRRVWTSSFCPASCEAAHTERDTRPRHARDPAAARTHCKLARRQARTVRFAADDRLQPGLQRVPSLAATHARHHLDSRSALAEEARIIEHRPNPGQPDETPQGLYSFDSRSIARIHNEAQWLGRPLLFATPALHLVGRTSKRLWHGAGARILSSRTTSGSIRDEFVKSKRPTVVFLARLDPIKRPWMFAELAAIVSPRRVQVPRTIAFFRCKVRGAPITCRRTCACAATSTKTRRRGCCRRRGLPSTPPFTKACPSAFSNRWRAKRHS